MFAILVAQAAIDGEVEGDAALEGAPAPGSYGGLPYKVGCPAFTRELRQFQWSSHRTFKPGVGEKYTVKTHPSEFLSIYTIVMQAAGARDDKVLG